MAGMFRPMFKIGKKFCFPQVPSGWYRWTALAVDLGVDPRPEMSKGYYGYPVFHPYCYPLPENYHIKDGLKWCYDNYHDLKYFMRAQMSEYPNYINKMVAESGIAFDDDTIKPPFDVISALFSPLDGHGHGHGHLVRNNGDIVSVESLRGKNFLVCCVYIPIFWLCYDAWRVQGIPTACYDYFSGKANPDYEILLVPKMRRNWANDEAAFNHFLSGFPSSCLAIPFSDSVRRDFVCKSLGLSDFPTFLLVDNNLQADDAVQYLGGSISSFPYIETGIPWWKTHRHLDEILGSGFVYKFGNCNDKVPISEIKKKPLVGLYLCYNGFFIRTLNSIYEQCKAQNLEFEVVLVYMPCRESVDPQWFQEAINYTLHKLRISWWVSPYNDVISRRLEQVGLSRLYNDDQVVIVEQPPGKKNFPDPYGKQIIESFGINAYPFTRKSLLKALSVEKYGSSDVPSDDEIIDMLEDDYNIYMAELEDEGC